MALPAGDPLWYYKVFGLHCDGANNSTTFTDVKGKTVTAYGNAKISTAQYPSLTGKSSSAVFDGTGDYLSSAASSDFNFGTGDFTIRCMFYLAADSSVDGGGNRNARLFCLTNATTSFDIDVEIQGDASTTGIGIAFYSSANGIFSRTVTVTKNVWHDVEVSRSGTSLRLFLDGTQLGATITNSASWGSSTYGAYVGGASFGSNYYFYFNGYISEVEVYKGVALHAADFTPSSDPFPDTYVRISGTTLDAGGDPAARLVRVYRRDTGALVEQVVSDATTGEYAVTAANSGTTTPLKHLAYMHTAEEGIHVPWRVLGLHCDGANTSTTFTDVHGKIVTANGNAQISTAQYPSLTGKTSSGYLDGTGDYLSLPDSADWSFGAGNFTVKARVRFDSSNPSYQTICSQYNTTSNWWFLRKEENTNNKLTAYFRTGGTVMANYIMTSNWSSWAADTWYEIVLVRSGSSIYIFIDGVSQTLTATVAVSTNNVGDVSSPLYVGSDTTYPLKGYISEVEIYKGVALHVSNFTPSSDPFPNAIGTATDNAVIFDDITPY